MTEMAKSAQFFRANVGVVVINNSGLVLALERRQLPGAWQLPQGGLDEGETPREAALRELAEETGIVADAVELLAEHPRWLAYELPAEHRRVKHGRGQVQKWFLFRLDSGDGRDVIEDLPKTPEARAFRWMSMRELADITVYFRKPVYREVARCFADYLAGTGT